MVHSVGVIPEADPTHARQALEAFTDNALYSHGMSQGALYYQAVQLADRLGYSSLRSVTPDQLTGVYPTTGTLAGTAYVPGVNEYTPEEHLRGITRTVAEGSAYGPLGRAFLLEGVVKVASSNSITDESSSPIISADRPSFSTRAARRAVMQELNGLQRQLGWVGVEPLAADLQTTRLALDESWHPYRPKVIMVAGAAGAAMLWRHLRSRQ